MAEPKAYTDEEIKELTEKAVEGVTNELTLERRKRREFEDSFKSMQKELDDMKAESEKKKSEEKTSELVAKEEYEKALELHKGESAKIIEEYKAEIDSLKSTVTTFRVDNEIMSAAGNAHDPGDVVSLIKAHYNIKEGDDGKIEILRKDGTPVYDKDGKGVDLKTLTEIYLSEKPHLVKPDLTGGAGSQSGQAPGELTSEQRLTEASQKGDRVGVIKELLLGGRETDAMAPKYTARGIN